MVTKLTLVLGFNMLIVIGERARVNNIWTLLFHSVLAACLAKHTERKHMFRIKMYFVFRCQLNSTVQRSEAEHNLDRRASAEHGGVSCCATAELCGWWRADDVSCRGGGGGERKCERKRAGSDRRGCKLGPAVLGVGQPAEPAH